MTANDVAFANSPATMQQPHVCNQGKAAGRLRSYTGECPERKHINTSFIARRLAERNATFACAFLSE